MVLSLSRESTTETFSINNSAFSGFMVDIVETESGFSAYLFNEDNCIKSLLFGVPKKQPNGAKINYSDFIVMVHNALETEPGYFFDYISEYMEQ